MRLNIVSKLPEAHNPRINRRAAILCGVKSAMNPNPKINSRKAWRSTACRNLKTERCMQRNGSFYRCVACRIYCPRHPRREGICRSPCIHGPSLRVDSKSFENPGIDGGRSNCTCAKNVNKRTDLGAGKSLFFSIERRFEISKFRSFPHAS